MESRAFDPDQLFRSLAREGGTPKLTWYGDDFERIELSGAVLTNWLNKTTNLLSQEFAAEPDFTIALALPVHWRTLVWSLAALRTGSTLTIASNDAPPSQEIQLTVTDSPTINWETDDLVLVTLGALARSYPGELPAGATDAARAVMTYSDALGFVGQPDFDAQALSCSIPPTAVSYRDLQTWLTSGGKNVSTKAVNSSAQSATRTLITVESNDAKSVLESIRQSVSLWNAGGSVVLCSAGVSEQLSHDQARLERITSSERVTDQLSI